MTQQTFKKKPPVVYEAIERHEFTFILLHGRCDVPSDFSRRLLASQSSRGEFGSLLQHVKMVFPHAGVCTYRPTIDNQWFDVDGPLDRTRGDSQSTGLCEHALLVKEIIDHEIQMGISLEKIVLFGFSQGCAQIMFNLLTIPFEGRLGAVVGMSGWLPFFQDLKTYLSNTIDIASPMESVIAYLRKQASFPLSGPSPKLQDVPIFIGHGTADEAIEIRHSECMHGLLSSLGMKTELNVYNVGHCWTEPGQLDDILSFLELKTTLRLPQKLSS